MSIGADIFQMNRAHPGLEARYIARTGRCKAFLRPRGRLSGRDPAGGPPKPREEGR